MLLTSAAPYHRDSHVLQGARLGQLGRPLRANANAESATIRSPQLRDILHCASEPRPWPLLQMQRESSPTRQRAMLAARCDWSSGGKRVGSQPITL